MSRGLGRGKLRKVDGYWQADYTDEHGKRVRRKFGYSKVDAEQHLAKVIRERDLALAGLPVPGRVIDRLIWTHEVERYLEACEDSLSPTTLKNYKSHLSIFSRTMHVYAIGEATAEVLETYRQRRMKGGISRSSANMSLAGVRGFFLWLQKTYDKSWANPAATVKDLEVKTKHRRRQRRALTDDELTRLLQAAEDLSGPDDPKTMLLWTLCQTGGRRSETALLTWGDIDLDEARITFHADRAKQGESRQVPIEPELLERLRQYAPRAPVSSSLAFPAEGGSESWATAKSFTDWLTAALRASCVEASTREGRIDTHALRHTYVTRLLRAGMSVPMVAKLTGHKDLTIINKIYAHLKVDDVAGAAIQALGTFRQKSGKDV